MSGLRCRVEDLEDSLRAVRMTTYSSKERSKDAGCQGARERSGAGVDVASANGGIAPSVYFGAHAGKGVTVNVTVAVLVDYANVSREGKRNIMRIFQEVNATFLPFPLPQMFLVLSLTAGPAEFGGQREMRVVLLDSDGNEVLALEAQFEIPHATRAGSRVFINEAIGMAGVTFQQAGDYQFSVLVGGDEKASVPLYVNDLTTGVES